MKFCGLPVPAGLRESLPPRGAWIEIQKIKHRRNQHEVAPPTGSVD